MNQLLFAVISPAFTSPLEAAVFHLDCRNGNDSKSGRAAAPAWKSLSKANANRFLSGDALEMKRGCRFERDLSLSLRDEAGKPDETGACGEGHAPAIGAKGTGLPSVLAGQSPLMGGRKSPAASSRFAVAGSRTWVSASRADSRQATTPRKTNSSSRIRGSKSSWSRMTPTASESVLKVTTVIFGNPIVGRTDIGTIEIK